MENLSQPISLSAKFAWAAGMAGIGLVLCVAGCSSTAGTKSSSSSSSSSTPQTAPVYMAPTVIGTSYEVGGSPASTRSVGSVVYSIDETNNTFQETDYDTLGTGVSVGVASQTLNGGAAATLGQRGLHTLATKTSYGLSANSKTATWVATSYNPPLKGGFAVELSGQAGGFVQLAGQPVAPVVHAAQCPGTSTQTYQFITTPATLQGWNPATDTAYGSVDISSSGSTVTFQNIHQFTLVSAAPAQPAATPDTGTCGPTLLGNVTNVPGQLVITSPGGPNGSTTPPQAMIGVGASNGLLVEDNGSAASGTMPGTNPPLNYNNILGAGTGAVGVAKPSSALDTGTVIGAQYLGFIYSPGTPSPTTANWSSHLASFGFSTVPSGCASVAASTGTLIYGGDYTNEDPSTSSSGYGNCDVAIDLGAQDRSNNGLYPQATVWMGAAYAGNPNGSAYSFPAVAIAGQINGKYAIFLLGFDNVQPWAIYLLQSN